MSGRHVATRGAAAALAALVVVGTMSDGWAQAAPPVATVPLTITLDPALPLASNLVDLEVFNADRERLGEIVDISVDPIAGVRAYVIAIGGRAGAGERHVSVAASAIRIVRAPGGVWTAELDASLDQLKAAPAIPYKSGWNP